MGTDKNESGKGSRLERENGEEMEREREEKV